MVQDIKLRNNVLKSDLPLSMVDTENYILDSVDWGVIEASHQEYKYINQYGVTIVGHTLGTRDVEIKGWVIASTDAEMTEMKKQLNRFFNLFHLITLHYSSYALDFYCQKTIRYGTEEKENNNVICHWVVDGIAPNPFFKKVVDNVYEPSKVVGMFHFPFHKKKEENVVFGRIINTTTFMVYNTGHVPTGFRVTFHARGGSVTNPSIMHVGKQKFIKINKTLQPGETIVVDTNRGERSVTGIIDGVRTNQFVSKDIESTWIMLDVGRNVMHYNADSGIDLLDVTLELNDMYEEVQECY